MLGYVRLTESQCRDEVSDRKVIRRRVAQSNQDFASDWLGQYGENVIHKKQGIPCGIPCLSNTERRKALTYGVVDGAGVEPWGAEPSVGASIE